ncbi:MAG TPA: DUF2924 domain-containing protein [Phycisphaerales bacterium]|nr:DUF2924 domain-containing protein [Phycisphaerales bacterium]
MNVPVLIKELEAMRVPELRTRYAEVFGEATRSNNRDYLVKRIAWRAQANGEGDLSERARRRAEELANDAELRRRAPATAASATRVERTVVAPIKLPRGSAAPMPGSLLVKEYQGKRIVVRVLEKGFEYEGKVYRSLSAIANAVTGGHWSGAAFFGLKSRKGGNAGEAA